MYIINKIREIWNFSSCIQLNISLVRYRVEHLKRNSISPRTHVLFLYLVESKVVWSVLYPPIGVLPSLIHVIFFSPYIVLNYVCGKYKVCHYLFRY